MSKGAVPIPYIIALLLGIAVVAIIGYWFFVLGGQWGGETNLQTCNTRAYTWCASWQALGYDGDDTSGPSIVGWFYETEPGKGCSSYLATMGLSSSNDEDVERDIGTCNEILGNTGAGGGTPTTGNTIETP